MNDTPIRGTNLNVPLQSGTLSCLPSNGLRLLKSPVIQPANHEKQQRRIKPLASPGLKDFSREAGRTL